MPRANPNIIVGSRVSAKMHYLRRTAFASAVLSTDTNAPRTSFDGTVTEMYMDGGIKQCNVTFDALPDVVIPLRLTCLRYLGRTPSRRRQPQPQEVTNDVEEPDLLEDAIQPIESGSESDDDDIDMNWAPCNITIDQRLASPDTNYQYVNPSLIGLSGGTATIAQFFLHFLPCAHIQGVVIPAINLYAQKLDSNWIDLDWIEYITWIRLLIIMTIVNCQDRKMYWRKSDNPYHINVDFSEFMAMDRFNDITQMHVFVVPNGEQ